MLKTSIKVKTIIAVTLEYRFQPLSQYDLYHRTFRLGEIKRGVGTRMLHLVWDGGSSYYQV